MTNKVKVIILISVVISILLVGVVVVWEYNWIGFSSEQLTPKLELETRLQNTTIILNTTKSFKANYILKNVGEITVRVVPFDVNFNPYAKYPNGSGVRYNGSIGGAPIFQDTDLIELQPGEVINYTYEFDLAHWAFDMKGNYTIWGVYVSDDFAGLLTLPFWKGYVVASPATLTVM